MGLNRRGASRKTILFALLLAAGTALAAASAVLEFFYDGNCSDCQALRQTMLADVSLAFPSVTVQEYDLREDAGVRLLLERQQALGITDTHPVAVVLNERVYFGGRQAIENRLLASLADLDSLETVPEAPSATGEPEDAAHRFIRGMGIWTVLAAGVIDGINPCAFVTVLFLVSLLMVRRRRPSSWLFSGCCFCAGVFMAYILLGLGILRIFTRLAAWRLRGESLRWLWVAVLALLAAVSLRDACVFKKTGRPELMRLQLPVSLRDRASAGALGCVDNATQGLGLFVVGALVTLLEAPCTGQIYGPVLFYLSRQPGGAQMWGLLLLYNLMFVIPSALVFTLAARQRFWRRTGAGAMSCKRSC